ncbi:serine O-acetyltransferase [Aestuariivirga sp.]|uniref:serine O-acetyltransferase n=1 Tax=Aestuariivirga sp. TaxID=2650926 RepID=UPI0039E2C63B
MSATIEPLRSQAAANRIDLEAIVSGLRRSREVTHNIRQGGRIRELPSPAILMNVMDGLVTSLFPTHLGPPGLTDDEVDVFIANTLQTATTRLIEQVSRGLLFNAGNLTQQEARQRARRIVNAFAAELPAIRSLLVSDLRAGFQHDPAAESIAEILLCYRSTTAIMYHRIAHALHGLGARLVARVISDISHGTTGIDIHPGARIGESFFIDRGTGVVIGETAVIGSNVRIHQGVTLGASESLGDAGEGRAPNTPRHPILEDNVVVHAGATILGRITVGAGSVIGGNVWLTRSVLPGSIITQAASTKGDVQLLK